MKSLGGKMDIDNMTVGEFKSLKSLFSGSTQHTGAFEDRNGTRQIAILQRGWVYVGWFHQQGTSCKLTNASCIRSWGTTKGLGELAQNGPTSNTKLDTCPDIQFHELTVICLMSCEDLKWNKSK